MASASEAEGFPRTRRDNFRADSTRAAMPRRSSLLLLNALVLSLCGEAAARKKASPQQLQQEFSKLVKDADDAIHAKRNKEAVKLLSDALEIMDGAGAQFAEGDVRFNRATALKALDRYEEAIADYEVTIRVNPKGACVRDPTDFAGGIAGMLMHSRCCWRRHQCTRRSGALDVASRRPATRRGLVLL